MSGSISAVARALAGELERRFRQDAELAERLRDAQERLTRANDRLWWGLHPDGLKAVYGDDPTPVEVAVAESHSEALDHRDPLVAVQQVRSQILGAFRDYQFAAEERRQLAAEIGEVIRRFVDELMAAGWPEEQARNANVHELASSKGRVAPIVG